MSAEIIKELQEKLAASKKEEERLKAGWEKANEENYTLKQSLYKAERELDVVKPQNADLIKTVLNLSIKIGAK